MYIILSIEYINVSNRVIHKIFVRNILDTVIIHKRFPKNKSLEKNLRGFLTLYGFAKSGGLFFWKSHNAALGSFNGIASKRKEKGERSCHFQRNLAKKTAF
jgi:hypothetical protein